MNKKQYFIIGITIVFFIVVIIVILMQGNNNENWTTDIKEAQNYQITMINCNDREKQLDNNVLNIISDKWNVLSNNGPWTGDTESCYNTVTISYETNGIIQEKEILLIDDTSLVLNEGSTSTYYTNAKEIIDYLNTSFKA